MFNQLSDRLNNIFRNLKGKGKISESNIQDSLKEIKLALLEADVNFKIVKNFISEVQKRAIGQEVLRSIEPGQQVVKIVHEQLISLMQTDDAPINFQSNRINKIMLVGLQGSGKTTCCAKLAQFYRKKGIKPLLVACDVYRPAAAQQLSILGKQLDIPVYVDNESKDVNYIAKKAMEFADKELCNLMIFDTAGRLHIDEKLMKEVKDLKDYTDPDYIFFVADAVTGQDAVNVAKEFNELLEFNGVILTKMDGDARGGAALSIRAVTNKPILYIGVGEKISDLEEFHADRMASRILGMGDILSLIEKAQETFDQEQAEKLATKLKKNEFSFQDFFVTITTTEENGTFRSNHWNVARSWQYESNERF